MLATAGQSCCCCCYWADLAAIVHYPGTSGQPTTGDRRPGSFAGTWTPKVKKTWCPSRATRPIGRRWSPFLQPSPRHQFTLPDNGYGGLVHRAVCLFTFQLSLVLTAPTHGGMARLSWPGWLVTYQHGLPACIRSPIQVLTGPGVD